MRLNFGHGDAIVETDFRLRQLSMLPALDGVRVEIPVTIDFRPKTALYAVRIDFFLDRPVTGRALICDGLIELTACPWDEEKTFLSTLRWPLSFRQLAIIEKHRANADLSLFVHADAMIGHMIRPNPEANPFPFDLSFVPTIDRAQGWVTIPADQWESARKKACPQDAVVVPIPQPSRELSPWSWVLDALIEAQQNFDRGGPPAWNACVESVRKGIEFWDRIEKIDGDRMKEILKKTPEQRSREERLLVIRKSLREYCNQAHHSLAEGPEPQEIWTREDAQFALATFASLMAKRQQSEAWASFSAPTQ